MKVSAFLRTIYLPSRIELTAKYADDLAGVVDAFSRHLGHDAKLPDFTEGNVAGFLTVYRLAHSASSTNSRRQSLLCLWRAAYDQAMLGTMPRVKLIRKLPVDLEPPEAWTLEQVVALVETAGTLPGAVAGIPASLWWTSLLLTVYWTACRIGALLRTPTASYDATGSLVVKVQKNHRGQLYTLPATCCEAIDAMGPDGRQMLWPWPHCRRWLFTRMRQICETAGVPCPKTGRQLFHRMRRTNLSYCAAVDPAIAQRQAGHRDYATTLNHYIDPRIARGRTAADVLADPMRAPRPSIRLYG